MADHHKGKTSGNRCAGYAPAGHPAKPGPDRNTDCGHCFAAAVLRGPDGAGVYQAAPGRGDRCGKAKQSEIWEKAYGAARGIFRNSKAVARPENIRQSGGQAAGDHPQHLFAVGEGMQQMKKYTFYPIYSCKLFVKEVQ